MDNKLLLIFILLFLSFLLLFYYLKLKSNIIMLLSIIVVLCINKLIVQKDYFDGNKFKEPRDPEDGYRQRDLIDYILNFGNETKPTPIKYDFIGSTPSDNSTINNTIDKTDWKEILKNIKSELSDRPTPHASRIPKYKFIGSKPLVKTTISQNSY